MAAALRVEVRLAGRSGFNTYVGCIVGDNSYPTGGWAIDAPGDLGYRRMVVGAKAGYVPEWDAANQKLKIYRDGETGSAGALSELNNGSSVLNGAEMDFIAI